MSASWEEDWLAAKTPTSLLGSLNLRRDSRKVRLLLIGHMVELEHFFARSARENYRILQEWTAGRSTLPSGWGDFGLPAPDGYITPRGLAHEALREACSFAAQNSRSELDASDMDKLKGNCAARAVVLEAVGNSPRQITLDHPWHEVCSRKWNEVRAKQADLVRCIFANPFRPVSLDPRWLTSSVLDLAAGI